MAILKSEDGKVFDVEDNASIKEAARELDVPFGCEHGVCGTCQVEVLEGEANLNELSEQEKDMGLDRNHRLCCQAIIKEGSVTIRV
tara:strand:+ start:10616 stop:10873 length:258 start_codon:yes stop_codon:yes gene_type:complete